MINEKYILCPVCGDFYFIDKPQKTNEDYGYFSKLEKNRNLNSGYQQCSRCGWIFDQDQLNNPDSLNGANEMSVNNYKIWYQEKLKENPDYDYAEENTPEPIPHKCPVCGKYKFEDEASFDICPYCGWEDDPVMEEEPNYDGGANELCLNDFKRQYQSLISENPNYKWESSFDDKD